MSGAPSNLLAVKILQVLPYLQSAGTERHVLALTQALLARGHSVRLLAPDGPLRSEFDKLDVIHTVFPPFQGGLAAALRGIAAGVEEAIGWDVDLIHVHAGVELLVGVKRALRRTSSRMRGAVPTVFTVHSYFGKRPSVDYFLAGRLGGRLADQVIAVSGQDADLLRRYAPNVAGKLTVVHNGMPDVSQADGDGAALKRSLLEEHGMRLDAPLCLVVGRLTAQKGIDLLLDALAIYRGNPPLLLVVGEGELRSALEAQARRLGNHAAEAGRDRHKVAFLGMRSDVPRLLAAVDLMILPSRMEGLSLALVEAHAAGVPCLVTDVGGNAEIVLDGRTGLIVKPEAPSALAEGLSRLLARPDLLRTMGAAARERYQAHFTVDHMTEKTCSIYQKALDQKRRNRLDTEGM